MLALFMSGLDGLGKTCFLHGGGSASCSLGRKFGYFTDKLSCLGPAGRNDAVGT